MKNERHLAAAAATLRGDKLLPPRALKLSDDDLVAIAQSVFNVADDLAEAEAVEVQLNLDSDALLDALLLAHRRNVTFNELVGQALERVVYDEKAKRLYDERNPNGPAWSTLTFDERHPYYIWSNPL